MAPKLKPSKEDALLHDHCTNELLNDIRVGRLQAGQRLSEFAMSRSMKVGRSAVRVAFDRLAWAGLLERIPRSGTYVKQISVKEYNEFMEVRSRLEGLAAGLACQRLTPTELDRLLQVAIRLDNLEAEVDLTGDNHSLSLDKDYAELQELEQEFHGRIVRGSGNPYIMQILEHYHAVERSFLMGMSFPARDASQVNKGPQHRDIAAVLRKKNPRLAEQAVLRHYDLVKKNLLARFGDKLKDETKEPAGHGNGKHKGFRP